MRSGPTESRRSQRQDPAAAREHRFHGSLPFPKSGAKSTVGSAAPSPSAGNLHDRLRVPVPGERLGEDPLRVRRDLRRRRVVPVQHEPPHLDPAPLRRLQRQQRVVDAAEPQRADDDQRIAAPARRNREPSGFPPAAPAPRRHPRRARARTSPPAGPSRGRWRRYPPPGPRGGRRGGARRDRRRRRGRSCRRRSTSSRPVPISRRCTAMSSATGPRQPVWTSFWVITVRPRCASQRAIRPVATLLPMPVSMPVTKTYLPSSDPCAAPRRTSGGR